MDSVVASHLAAPGLFPGIPDIFSKKKLSMLLRFIDSPAAQSSGQQRLNYVDRAHLVVASGMLVLQKRHAQL